MFPNLGFRAGHLTMLRFPKGKGMVTRTTTNEPCSTERTFVASTRGKKRWGGGERTKRVAAELRVVKPKKRNSRLFWWHCGDLS